METKTFLALAESSDLLETVTGHTWELAQTGGGRNAFLLYVRDGFFTITNKSENAPKPHEMGKITLTFYSHESLDVATIFDDVRDLDSLAVFLARHNQGGK